LEDEALHFGDPVNVEGLTLTVDAERYGQDEQAN
jgi:hypothetical protein